MVHGGQIYFMSTFLFLSFLIITRISFAAVSFTSFFSQFSLLGPVQSSKCLSTIINHFLLSALLISYLRLRHLLFFFSNPTQEYTGI